MDIVNLLITLVSGVVGGNAAGAAMPDKNLGVLANSVSGLVGGAAGDFILKALGILASTGVAGAAAANGADFDISSILANVGVSGVSGAALTAIVALIKNALQKS